MNLNPLKKEDNTEALVKALEDASGGGQPAAAATTMPADTPSSDQATADAANPVVAAPMQSTDAGTPAMATDDIASTASPDGTMPAQTADTNADAALTFNGNDLPAGLSTDADAHLPSEGSGDNTELDGVKKSALEQLRPLIEKLDLEPADKFDKYLMMLRASDDPALIKPAFDAAQGIMGEKEKAQALLDIINEINYITASQQQS